MHKQDELIRVGSRSRGRGKDLNGSGEVRREPLVVPWCRWITDWNFTTAGVKGDLLTWHSSKCFMGPVLKLALNSSFGDYKQYISLTQFCWGAGGHRGKCSRLWHLTFPSLLFDSVWHKCKMVSRTGCSAFLSNYGHSSFLIYLSSSLSAS